MDAQTRMTSAEVRMEVDKLKSERQAEADKLLVNLSQRFVTIAGFYIFSFILLGIALVAMQIQISVGVPVLIAAVIALSITTYECYTARKDITDYWKFAYENSQQMGKVIANLRTDDPVI